MDKPPRPGSAARIPNVASPARRHSSPPRQSSPPWAREHSSPEGGRRRPERSIGGSGAGGGGGGGREQDRGRRGSPRGWSTAEDEWDGSGESGTGFASDGPVGLAHGAAVLGDQLQALMDQARVLQMSLANSGRLAQARKPRRRWNTPEGPFDPQGPGAAPAASAGGAATDSAAAAVQQLQQLLLQAAGAQSSLQALLSGAGSPARLQGAVQRLEGLVETLQQVEATRQTLSRATSFRDAPSSLDAASASREAMLRATNSRHSMASAGSQGYSLAQINNQWSVPPEPSRRVAEAAAGAAGEDGFGSGGGGGDGGDAFPAPEPSNEPELRRAARTAAGLQPARRDEGPIVPPPAADPAGPQQALVPAMPPLPPMLRPENLSALRTSAMGLARSSVEAVREVEGLVVRLTMLQQQLAEGRRASQSDGGGGGVAAAAGGAGGGERELKDPKRAAHGQRIDAPDA
ncbi:hypothetical protein GPECTOR_12g443 [Gonium pectorale]|uniref:Uncharacterized protein n=1 Tax=Gonium pectorale TaxID=33097 RepID=A0A150GQ61_GONPE|nr:hypothetical protein GPECTOR_12g443 [Gonium pectorale]|eukprot:KXZ51480.1 hypothetical protein GPECTOR_12g443 [Gonium pectorale]